MSKLGLPAGSADEALHVAVHEVVGKVAVRFGRKVPLDLEIVIRYYIGAHSAFVSAARHLLASARAHGIDGGAR